MHLFEISVPIKKGVKADELMDQLGILVLSYYQNGQTMNKNESYFIQGKKAVYHVAGLEKDSLNGKYNNKYITEQINRIQKEFDTKITTRLLGPVHEESLLPCTCKKHPFYILYTTYVDPTSPLVCGKCYKAVPLYRLPKTSDGTYFDILAWQRDYQHTDSLQMGCRVGERWAMNQMQEHQSQLTRQGQKVGQRITELTGKPVYYYLWDYRKNTSHTEKKCPGCNRSWKLKKPLHGFFEFKCDHCLLLSTLSPNS